MKANTRDINNKKITTEKPVSASQKQKVSCDDNYHALFEQATDAIMVTDFKGNFLDVNSSLCTMFGYTKDELLVLNIRSLLDEEDLKIHPIRFDLLAAGENILHERKMVHKNGTIIYVESNAQKFTENCILVIARNITERKRTEGILKKSEANLHTIFDTTDIIYVLMDKDLRIISYNPRARVFAEKELGHHIEISEYFLDYFPPEKRPVLLEYMTAVLAGRQINYEISYPQPGNLFNWYHVRLFPISHGDNNVYGLMMEVSDITEKTLLGKNLEEERIKKQQEITDAVITAEENERHEIGLELHDNVNQLLATSRLYIGIAKQRIGKKNFELISDADSFINTAINEIRNLSHSLISPFIDEYGLLQALDHLTGAIEKGSVLNIYKEIAVDENKLGDKLKLAIYRIVQEQLNNIIKYAKATTITISLTEEKDTLSLIVKDNGVGFDTSKSSKGIGLMNISTRASLFKGRLAIISSPGNGCMMKVTLQTTNSTNNEQDFTSR